MPSIVPYNSTDSAIHYDDYYRAQVGSGVHVYKGSPMLGGGLGNVFAGLMRSVAPVLKRAGTSLLKKGLSSAADVAKDVVSGKNVAASAKRRFGDQAKDLLGDLVSAARPDENKRKRMRPAPSRRGKKRRATIFDR